MTDLKVGDKVDHMLYGGAYKNGEILFIFRNGENAVVKWQSREEGSHSTAYLEKIVKKPGSSVNPNYAKAVTGADIKPGFEFLEVSDGVINRKPIVVTSEAVWHDHVSDWKASIETRDDYPSTYIWFGDQGITPYARGHWNPRRFAIPNTTQAVIEYYESKSK